MAKRKSDYVDYGAEVTRIYGVVPRPRYRDCPEAWARTKRPGKWRTYYGYRYRPDSAVPEKGSARDMFSAEQIAAATIAYQERGGRIVAAEPAPKPEIKVSYMHGRKPEPVRVPHIEHIREYAMRQPTEYDRLASIVAAAMVEPVAPAPEPVREPEPVPAPAPAPIIAPQEAAPDRMAIAAAVLRDLAAKYGPRRSHKLLAMADFVTAAAGIAA